MGRYEYPEKICLGYWSHASRDGEHPDYNVVYEWHYPSDEDTEHFSELIALVLLTKDEIAKEYTNSGYIITIALRYDDGRLGSIMERVTLTNAIIHALDF